MNFIHSNAYPGLARFDENQIAAMRGYAEYFKKYKKPVMVSEYGGHWSGDPASIMRRDIIGGLFAGVCSDLSGTPLNWWWNFTYGESLGRYYKFVSNFLKGEDLIAQSDKALGGWKHRHIKVNSKKNNARALMIGNNEKRFIYLHNFDTQVKSSKNATTCENTKITIKGLNKGDYRVELWDPEAGGKDGAGGMVGQQALKVQGDSTQFNIKDFTASYLLKIVPASLPEKTVLSQEVLSLPQAMPDVAGLTWRVTPITKVIHPAAARRSVFAFTIALPKTLRGAVPVVKAKGALVKNIRWRCLDDGMGWEIWVPTYHQGPFDVTARVQKLPVTDKNYLQASVGSMDTDQIGLALEVSELRTGTLRSLKKFKNHFARDVDEKITSVKKINHLENIFGSNDRYLSYYHGSLMIPHDGEYQLATNSDDGSVLVVNGKQVAAWFGGHRAEGKAIRLENHWRRNGKVKLKAGLHYIEYYQQETGGGQLSRAGWRLPKSQSKEKSLLELYCQESLYADQSQWQVVPSIYFSGKIQCRVDILCLGKPVGQQ